MGGGSRRGAADMREADRGAGGSPLSDARRRLARGQGRRIAVVGGGAAGLLTAWLLQSQHQVTLYESAAALGGHARTVRATWEGGTFVCETGFKYFFASTYPTLTALLEILGLKTRARPLGVTVTLEDGTTLVLPPRTLTQALGLAASPRRVVDLLHYERLLRGGGELLARRDFTVTLRRYVEQRGLSPAFAEAFVYPTLAAHWGTAAESIAEFPAYSVLKVLSRFRGRGNRYLEIEGGVAAYVDRLAATLTAVQVRSGVAVSGLARAADGGVAVVEASGRTAAFDEVVLATSARDAARLVAGDPAARPWHEALSCVPHFPTTIAIHGDERYLPRRRKDWSLINVFHDRARGAWQTEWSGMDAGAPVYRTWLREGDPLPRPLHHLERFHHLLVTCASRGVQQELDRLQGEARLWAVGMYTTDVDNHESALTSALRVARALAPASPDLARILAAVGAHQADPPATPAIAAEGG